MACRIWGPHVGYYGGINYGFGYFGSGYEGGHWKNGLLYYNTAVTRVDTTVITNTYNKQVISTAAVNNVSFNGPGGITAQPTAKEVAWSRERHTQPTALQLKHQRTARANRALFAAVNQGTPTVAATAKPGVFKGPEIVGPKAVSNDQRDSGYGVNGARRQSSPAWPSCNYSWRQWRSRTRSRSTCSRWTARSQRCCQRRSSLRRH